MTLQSVDFFRKYFPVVSLPSPSPAHIFHEHRIVLLISLPFVVTYSLDLKLFIHWHDRYPLLPT